MRTRVSFVCTRKSTGEVLVPNLTHLVGLVIRTEDTRAHGLHAKLASSQVARILQTVTGGKGRAVITDLKAAEWRAFSHLLG